MPRHSAQDIEQVAAQAESEIAQAGSPQDLERLRVLYLGRKGVLSAASRSIGELPEAQRPSLGRAVNEAQRRIAAALDRRREELAAQAAQGAAAGQLDVTLPGRGPLVGHRHPLMITLETLLDIFVGLGYAVLQSPEVEWFALNFTALNYPPDHPAMDDQDTFYVNEDIVLRTQTSPGQIRTMRASHDASCPVRGLDDRFPPLEVLSQCRCTPPPVRVVIPGRCYRREAVTPTHHDVFYQLEGLVVDEGIALSHLKGTLAAFLRAYLGPGTRIRFRPDFFPFTEPSADFSVSCEFCQGEGCRFCKQSGWVEIGGAGMVHPNVLIGGGYDPDRVSGFAFGFGVERLAQRRFGIEDIRTLYENDMRFLRQF